MCVVACDDDDATDACGDPCDEDMFVVKLFNKAGFCTTAVSFFWLKGGKTGAKIAPFLGTVWDIALPGLLCDGGPAFVLVVCMLFELV